MRAHLIAGVIATTTVWAVTQSAIAHTYSLQPGVKAFGHCAKGPCAKRTDWSASRAAQHRKQVPHTLSVARQKRFRDVDYADRH